METNLVFNAHTITDPTISSITNLDELNLLENNYTHIHLGDILNFLDLQEIIPMLTQVKSKLAKGGCVTIEQFDQFEVCLGIVSGKLSSADFNNINSVRKNILNIQDTFEVVSKAGYKIANREIDAFKHLIRAINE